MDGFPLGRAGREIDGNPVVIASVGLVENVVEYGRVIGGGFGHLVDGDGAAAGRMAVAQIESLFL